MEKIRIQISPNRIVKDAVVIWHEPHPDVDIVMDPKNLTFRPGSVDAIYTFHVLDHLFPGEVKSTLTNWFNCLGPGGKLHIIVDDFEYIARAFVGADITIEMINELHSHPSHYTKEDIVSRLKSAGFPEETQIMWYEDTPEYPKVHYEIAVVATKP